MTAAVGSIMTAALPCTAVQTHSRNMQNWTIELTATEDGSRSANDAVLG